MYILADTQPTVSNHEEVLFIYLGLLLFITIITSGSN